MIQYLKRGLAFFFTIIDWGEILIGFLMLFMGMAFNKHYGYRFGWETYLYICLWYFFIKLSVDCLEAVLSGEVYRRLSRGKYPGMSTADLRNLVIKGFWILSLTLIAMSFIPLIQIYNQSGSTSLTLLILSLIYFLEFMFFLEPVQRQFGGMLEFCYAFSSAYLLPALCFSLAQNYLKPQLIWLTFPLFIQLIAWKAVSYLEKSLKQKPIPSYSLVERLSTPNSLYVITALIVLGSLTLFLDRDIVGIWNKLMILPIGLLAAWLTFKSIRVQVPNWERGLAVIRLLPVITVVSVIVSLWLY